jgi:hypothetical protein
VVGRVPFPDAQERATAIVAAYCKPHGLRKTLVVGALAAASTSGTPITLRHGARVIEDSRRLRVV